MAARNGMGPLGQGPMTGRGLGFCATDGPANYNVGFGRGFGFGCRRGGGRGFGQGMGRNFMEDPTPLKTQKELLTEQKEFLESRLEFINTQLDG